MGLKSEMPKRGIKKRVIEFITNGYRYREHDIKNETPKTFVGSQGNEEFRIYKHGHVYTGEKGDLLIPATPGSIWTAVVDEVEDEYVTLGALLEDVWGHKGITEHLPEELAEPLKQRWLTPVTIRAVDVDPDAQKAVDKLIANELLHDSNIRQAGEAGSYEKEKGRQEIILDWILKIGFGAGLWEIIRNLGILH